jgi:hypothetical protein
MISREELVKHFKYHPPKDDEQKTRYEQVRRRGYEAAVAIVEETPESREQSLALTHLEQAIMWANAAIAWNENS